MYLKEKLVKTVKSAMSAEIVRVRFDSDKAKWAVLGEDSNPTRYFDFGYMTHVTFSSMKVHNGLSGCRAGAEFIGIAEGKLKEGKYHPKKSSLQNLSFSGSSFVDVSGNALSACAVLQLMPERRALYILTNTKKALTK